MCSLVDGPIQQRQRPVSSIRRASERESHHATSRTSSVYPQPGLGSGLGVLLQVLLYRIEKFVEMSGNKVIVPGHPEVVAIG